ncbi:p23 chaperone protein wos2 [Cystobasidiomycetes sp. EMM_F5]
MPELDNGYTLEFPDEGKRLVFKGKTRSYESAGHTEKTKNYELDLELFDAVLGDKIRKSLTGKSLLLSLPKKELKTEYWPRLTKNKTKLQFVKTDFDKWVDEDEQDGAPEVDTGMPDVSVSSADL